MERQKIGSQYFRSGHNRTSPRKANVYLIDGKAYAKDIATWKDCMEPLTGYLEGYVSVNYSKATESFFQVSGLTHIDLHKIFEK